MKNIAIKINEDSDRTKDNNKRPGDMSKEGSHAVTKSERCKTGWKLEA